MSFNSSTSASANSSKRSRPSSRSKSNTGGRNPSKRRRSSPFVDFGSYMADKNRKLRDQFDAHGSTSSLGSGDRNGIFSGVSIFVDGFTVPSSQELKVYMLKHGGRFENYFSRHRVTHIICSNLPDSKMKNFRAFSRGLPVVKPEWILDSLAANKLLSYVPYQLCELVKESGKQQKLSAFFTLKSISSLNDTEITEGPCVELDAYEENKQAMLSQEGQFSSYRMEDLEESACLGNEIYCEEEVAELKFTDLEEGHSIIEPSDSSPHRLLNMAGGSCNDDNDCKKSSDAKLRGASNHLPSTLSDPNFVENYFKSLQIMVVSSNVKGVDHAKMFLIYIRYPDQYGSTFIYKREDLVMTHLEYMLLVLLMKNSRLHFIGTWRNRYRRRFSNALSGNRPNKADIQSSPVSLKASVMHVDMDSFFVSVVIRNYPDLLNTPVAVCHSDNPKGTAEISSANYPARDYGVRAGMFVRDAKACCPQLIIVPYDFKAYEEVADQFYGILHKHCNKVQALSCDEAFLDVTWCANNDPEHLALVIRKEIAETTRCTASAGIAENMLLARLATRSAKPNGQCFISSEKVDDYLKDLPIKALPGIGKALGEKLKSRQIHTCGQLRTISKEALNKDFGAKTGDMLWNYCRGIDNRTVDDIQEMKSVGAEVNWGVRFNDTGDCQLFLVNLCKEVSFRLQECGVEGRTITLKVKKRRKGAEEPAKFMGCGDCESMSRSLTLPTATDSVILLQRITKQIFSSLHIDVKDVRGVGLQMSRLVNVELGVRGHERSTLESWLSSVKTGKLTSSSANPESLGTEKKPRHAPVHCGVQHDGISGLSCSSEALAAGPSHINASTRSHENRISMLPPLVELDADVIKNLPPEIYSEMNDMYNGKLHDFMKTYEEKDGKTNKNLSIIYPPEVKDNILPSGYIKIHCNKEANMTSGETGVMEPYPVTREKGKQPLSAAALSTLILPMQSEASAKELKTDIHNVNENMSTEIANAEISERAQTSGKDPTTSPRKFSIYEETQYPEKSKNGLWLGNPPNWVKVFKTSSCLVLNVIAELYTKSGTSNTLSGTLQSAFSLCPLNFDLNGEGWDDALSSLCELIVQYIDLKIESDIEELYICFRLFKRFASTSKLLLQVYNIVLPTLQASVNEHYGGQLQLSPAK